MLHPIDRPQCAEQLYELTELAKLTLTFATQHDTITLAQVDAPDSPYRYQKAVAKSTNVSEGLVNRAWNGYIDFMEQEGRKGAGEWLFNKYAVVTTPVIELLKIPLSQKRIPNIVQLFADDLALLDQLANTQNDLSDSSQFHYHSVMIDPGVNKQIKILMRNFYEKLFRNKSNPIPGFVVGSTEDLNRNVLLQEYNYLHVCPGCDGEHQSIQNGQLVTQADHFFPLSHYPFFAVHPLNLVPYCIQCNSTEVKGDKDIIEISSATNLNEIFHPYRPAQQHIHISVQKKQAQITLDISDEGQSTARMTGFLNLLHIKSRWEGVFFQSGNLSKVGKYIYNLLKSQIKGAIQQAKRSQQQFLLDEGWLFESLTDLVFELPQVYGNMAGAMTARAYAEWVRNEFPERNSLMNKLQKYIDRPLETNHELASQGVQQSGRFALGI